MGPGSVQRMWVCVAAAGVDGSDGCSLTRGTIPA